MMKSGKVNEKGVYYFVLFDLADNVPVVTMLTKKLNYNIIKNFIDMSIPFKESTAIVTGSKIEYD